MTQLKVVQAPTDILNQKAKPVTFKEPGLAKLILDMHETLIKHKNPPGVGLAAPQVGVGLQIFLAVLGQPVGKQDEIQGQIELFINPEILETFGNSGKTKEGRHTAEGCLSLKNYYGSVSRATKVKIKYQTLDFQKLQKTLIRSHQDKRKKNPDWKKLLTTKTKIYRDFEARIMQHETDHLNGRLFTSRILEQQGKLYTIEEDNGEQIWEEVKLDL